MANRNEREALRRAEVQTLDHFFQILTPKEWAELLIGPLERAAYQGNNRVGLVQKKLVEAGADSMANEKGRETIRGADAKKLDIIAEVFTSKQCAELLEGPLLEYMSNK